MERRKVPAADGSGNVEATDLYVGAAVTLNRHEFHLVGADDFTLNFMEQRRVGIPVMSPHSRLSLVPQLRCQRNHRQAAGRRRYLC